MCRAEEPVSEVRRLEVLQQRRVVGVKRCLKLLLLLLQLLGLSASPLRAIESLLCGIIERLLGLWASPSGDGRIAPHPDTTSLGPS